nr:immunoglobulin light chain junction region [Macaca mulatta]
DYYCTLYMGSGINYIF